SLSDTNPRLEAAYAQQNLSAALLEIALLTRYGRPNQCVFVRQRKLKVGWQDSDDGVRLTVKRQLLTQGVFIAGKSTLPEVVTDYCDRVATPLLFVDLKIATAQRR